MYAPYDDVEALDIELGKAWEMDWWVKYDAERRKAREKECEDRAKGGWGTPPEGDTRPLVWSSASFARSENDGTDNDESPEMRLRGGGVGRKKNRRKRVC